MTATTTTNKQNRGDTFSPQPTFSQVVYLFLSQKFVKQAQTVYFMEWRYLLCAISL